MDNFRGILILPKKTHLGNQTRKDLRDAGYVLLFLENVDSYRVSNHVPMSVKNGGVLLLQTLLEAKETDFQRDIVAKFGKKVTEQVRESLK